MRGHLKSGRTAEAIELAARGLHDDPEDDRLRYHYAIALLEAGGRDRVAEARRQLEQLVDGDHAGPASLALAELAVRDRDYGSARRYYKLARRLDARLDADLDYRLGRLLQEQFPERRREARRYLRRATRKRTATRADAFYRLGQLELERGSWRKAARAFKAAVSFDSEHPFAAYELATLYQARDRSARAKKYFEIAVKANPELDTETNRAAFATPTPEMEHDGFDAYIRERRGDASNADGGAGVEADALGSGRGQGQDAKSVATGEEGIHDQQSSDLQSANPQAPTALPAVLTVLISGASSGIGRATARRFAEEGHRLILTGRRVERLRELSAELTRGTSAQVRLLSFDVRSVREATHALNTLPDDWRDIDVLVNNAGKAKGLDFIHEGQLEHWEEMIDTNVKGLLYLTRLVSPRMVGRRRGHIINVCSTAGHEVYPRGAVYCATKHAVDAITRGTRLDLHRHNVRVSQVSPAHVEETEFAAVRFDGDEERAGAVYEGFQPLRAADVARQIYHIATEPPHVNVQDILVLGTQQANSTTIARTGR